MARHVRSLRRRGLLGPTRVAGRVHPHEESSRPQSHGAPGFQRAPSNQSPASAIGSVAGQWAAARRTGARREVPTPPRGPRRAAWPPPSSCSSSTRTPPCRPPQVPKVSSLPSHAPLPSHAGSSSPAHLPCMTESAYVCSVSEVFYLLNESTEYETTAAVIIS